MTVQLVNERILNQLQIKTYYTGVNVYLNGIGGDNVLAISNRKVNLKIVSAGRTFVIKSALVVKNLSLPIQILSQDVVELCNNKLVLKFIHIKLLQIY